MKKLSVILFVATAMASQQASWAQPAGQAVRALPPPGLAQTTEPELPRFNLDFPGGTPAELVRAIEQQSSSRPLNLNVIIPNDPAVKAILIPPFVMKSVTVPELFNALGAASSKEIFSNVGLGSYQQRSISAYSFRTEGRPREDSIWYFHVDSPALPHGVQTIRFFQLGPYLQNYKVEDITTAIETGWKMLGEEPYPKLSFHKDTKLLIAVGDPAMVANIESVLSQLPKDHPAAEQAPAPAKNNEPPKRQ